MRKKILLLASCFLFLTVTKAQNVDIDWLRHINLNRNTSFDPVMKLTSSSVTPISIAVPLTEFAVGIIKHDNKLKTAAVVDIVSLGCAYAVTYSLKYIVNRDRPYDTYDYIQNLGTDKDPSFPSGHTTNAFATATSLSLAFKKWYVVVPAYTYATAVGYSRMHMGMHYPSDVLAGALIGSGSAVVCHFGQKIIARKCLKRKNVPANR